MRLLLLIVSLSAASSLLSCTSGPAESESERPLFTDVSDELGLDFVHRNGMVGELYFVEVLGAGAALFDADGDGDLDLYLAQGHALSPQSLAAEDREPAPGDRLLRNDLTIEPSGERHMHFVDVTDAAGLDATGYGMGVAAGDVDNDGFVDLYLANYGPNQLWRNTAGETGAIGFEEIAAVAGADDASWSIGAAFLDIDADGWLDLYVVNYVDYRVEANKTCRSASRPDYCGPESFPPATDRLFRNRGPGADGRVVFEDISGSAGILEHARAGLGVVTSDFDGDGDIDIYVANDQDRNLLWINGGDLRFEDQALLSGCAANALGMPEASMGVDAGDLDLDGDDDLFMTHLRTETNTLFANDGTGFFEDVTAATRIGAHSFGTTGFGTVFFDIENDGWLDLAIANGAVTLIEEQLAAGEAHPVKQPNELLRNVGKGGSSAHVLFEDVTGRAAEAFAPVEASRGLAAGDVDNDGDIDLVVTNNHGRARLLRNDVGQDAPWLGLRLLDRGADSEMDDGRRRDALGARVILRREGAPDLLRRVRTDGSYGSAHDPRVLFGLGAGTDVTGVEVRWPGGERELFPPPPLGRYSTLTRGEGTRGEGTGVRASSEAAGGAGKVGIDDE